MDLELENMKLFVEHQEQSFNRNVAQKHMRTIWVLCGLWSGLIFFIMSLLSVVVVLPLCERNTCILIAWACSYVFMAMCLISIFFFITAPCFSCLLPCCCPRWLLRQIFTRYRVAERDLISNYKFYVESHNLDNIIIIHDKCNSSQIFNIIFQARRIRSCLNHVIPDVLASIVCDYLVYPKK